MTDIFNNFLTTAHEHAVSSAELDGKEFELDIIEGYPELVKDNFKLIDLTYGATRYSMLYRDSDKTHEWKKYICGQPDGVCNEEITLDLNKIFAVLYDDQLK